ncbi:MAG: hypothetical protein Q8K59_08305, partial [Nitrosomonas sp.]|nr:hypothetical protein [Nitrosomonas sp.]MDP1951077.1 hypothetical protein [Nitrosomonas sp.]
CGLSGSRMTYRLRLMAWFLTGARGYLPPHPHLIPVAASTHRWSGASCIPTLERGNDPMIQ